MTRMGMSRLACSVTHCSHPSLPEHHKEPACPPDPAQWDVPAQQYFRLSTRVTVALSKEPPSIPPACELPLPHPVFRSPSMERAALQARMKAAEEDDGRWLMCCESGLSHVLFHTGYSCARLQQTALTFPGLGSLICSGSTVCTLETSGPN